MREKRARRKEMKERKEERDSGRARPISLPTTSTGWPAAARFALHLRSSNSACIRARRTQATQMRSQTDLSRRSQRVGRAYSRLSALTSRLTPLTGASRVQARRTMQRSRRTACAAVCSGTRDILFENTPMTSRRGKNCAWFANLAPWPSVLFAFIFFLSKEAFSWRVIKFGFVMSEKARATGSVRARACSWLLRPSRRSFHECSLDFNRVA